jgi:hypothetical protein
MKKIFLFLFLALPGLPVLAQPAGNKEPYLEKSLSSEAVKNAEVRTSGGSISVTAVDAQEARIEVYVTGNNGKASLSREEIKDRLDEKYELMISVVDNKLIAVAKLKSKITDWKRALSISFKVFVPKNVSTDLVTSGGSISLSGIAGGQDFSTSGGSLYVDNVSGKINGRTSGGSIHVQNSTNDIELATSGGSIYAKNCTGKIRLTTSGGSLDLEELEGDIKATTSGGSITADRIAGELVARTSGGNIDLDDMACSLEASTSGGNINVHVETLGNYVKLSNSGGNVDLQLPKDKGIDLDLSAHTIKTDQLSNFSGKLDKNNIEGKLNGGGVPVDVVSGSGRIYLAFK